MNTLNRTLTAVVAIAVAIMSCRKDPPKFGPSNPSPFTPLEKPNLLIIVGEWNPAGGYVNYVGNCLIKVYRSQQDYDADVNAVDSGFTYRTGGYIFQLDSARYWIRCEKDCMSNELFNFQTDGPITRYSLNLTYIPISGIAEVALSNKTNLDYSAYYKYPYSPANSSWLPAHGSLRMKVPSPSRSLTLESRSLYPDPEIKRQYDVNLECGESMPIEVF